MRLREIDFLRGIAVILVLFRHYDFIDILLQVGWIGVDLFFVLSGFLVSGLLFHEYKKYGGVDAKSFLIRRGFKIYPIFYLFLLITVVVQQMFYEGVDKAGFVAEAIFVQNYLPGNWDHTWSLAVEEHFYIGAALVILGFVKLKKLESVKVMSSFFLAAFITCLLLRFYTSAATPFDLRTHAYPTHLRMDSLLFGVALSYFYSFRKEQFTSFFRKWRRVGYGAAALMILPAFFMEVSYPFMHTVGFTLLYLGFGIILANFITDSTINKRLDAVFGRGTVNFVSVVGYSSYAVYLFHMMISRYVLDSLQTLGLASWIGFIIYFFSSIILGVFITYNLEKKILAYRDRWFPKKTAVPVVEFGKDKEEEGKTHVA